MLLLVHANDTYCACRQSVSPLLASASLNSRAGAKTGGDAATRVDVGDGDDASFPHFGRSDFHHAVAQAASRLDGSLRDDDTRLGIGGEVFHGHRCGVA